MAKREALRVEALMLSKSALMWRKMVETLSLGPWRVLTSCARERQASEVLRLGREPHWLGWSIFLERAIAESLTVMTRSRIFDTVLRKTIMWKDAGELYQAFPGLSKTTPFAFFSEGGWYYSKATRGETILKRIPEFIRLTFFQTTYKIPSGPGAKEGEDLLKASLISSSVRVGAEWFHDRRPLGGRRSFGGKKWSRRALLMDTRSLAPGREGNLGGSLGLRTVLRSIYCEVLSW